MSSTEVLPVQRMENPIIAAHRVFDGLEKDANDLVERAGRDGEVRKDLWKISNSKKAQEQQELAGLYTYMAYLGVATTILSAACGAIAAAQASKLISGGIAAAQNPPVEIPGYAMSKKIAEYTGVAAQASQNVHDKIVSPVNQNSVQGKQANIEGHTNTSQDYWAIQQDITTSRKEQLQNVKRGVGDAASASIGKLGECMGTRG